MVEKTPLQVHNGTFFTLLILFSLSLILNVWLGIKVRSNTDAFGSLQMLKVRSGEAAIGVYPNLTHASDLDGHSFRANAPNDRIIYYFSTTCHWCALNFESLKSLARQASPRYDVVGLTKTSDGLNEYLKLHPQPFPIIVEKNEDDLSTLDLRGTPQTVVISNGMITHNWLGAFQGRTKESIEKTLGISLPDLATTEK